LAEQLDDGSLDVGLVSTFELFRNPGLMLLPGISISADGPVKSVRLFSKVPFDRIQSVALDTSSLTSTALIRILLAELYGVKPCYRSHSPNLVGMLEEHDAALIIGDLRLFETPAEYVLDLGEAWKRLTGRPFVYAAWLATPQAAEPVLPLLVRAKEWGCARLEPLSVKWSDRLNLPLDRVRDYFFNVMQFDFDSAKMEGMELYRTLCLKHSLIADAP
jgi:chorismate dehydratase